MIGYSPQTQDNYNNPELSRRIAEAQQKAQLMQLKPYENMAQQEQALYNMAATYNADPNGLSPSQRLYIKEMAKASGGAIDISKGLATESKATAGEHALAFLGGIGDSLLFDLLKDEWYSDDRTAKTAGWGKLTGAVGSLAIGGYGALNAVKAAKAASGVISAAKIAATAADDVGKVLVKEYGDDVAKLLGKEVLKKTGAEVYEEITKAALKQGPKSIDKASAAKELLLIAKSKFPSVVSDVVDDVVKIDPKATLKAAKAAKAEALEAITKLRTNTAGETWVDDLIRAERDFRIASRGVTRAQKAASAGRASRIAAEVVSGGFRGSFGHAIAPGASTWTRAAAGFGAAGLAVPRVVRPVFNNDNASIMGTPQFRTYFTDYDRNSLPYGGADPYAAGELMADGMSQ